MNKLHVSRIPKPVDDTRTKVFSGEKEVRKVHYTWTPNGRLPQYRTFNSPFVATCMATKLRREHDAAFGNHNNVHENVGLNITIVTPTGYPIVMEVRQTLWENWYKGWNGNPDRQDIGVYFSSKSMSMNHYRANALMPGHNYALRDRGIWNPELDDTAFDYIRDDEAIENWVTKQYIWMFPKHKEHFKNSRFHSPTMAELAVKYPGYAMMVRAGWSPTIAYSPSYGWQRTMYNQPNPKRLINYVYGKYSREFFNHLNENIMPNRNNWFGLWLIRMGRDFIPSEWLAREINLQLATEERWSPHDTPALWRQQDINYAIGNSKPKRLMEIISQAALSTANADLFGDSLRMYSALKGHNAEAYGDRGMLEAYNFRYLDELHTRITEQYREITRVNQYAWLNGRRIQIDASTDLKPDERLLANLDGLEIAELSFEVAKKAGVVQVWGDKQNHCIASYIPSAHTGGTTLIGVYKNRSLIANASVSGKHITQLRGAANANVPDPEKSIVQEAIKRALDTVPKKKTDEKKEKLIAEKVS